MQIPNSILNHVKEPHWQGVIQDEHIEIYYDYEMSKLSSSDVYAVFSAQGFHGWMDYGYEDIHLLWIATSLPIDYSSAVKEFKKVQQLTNV